jgi:hypothetical protein
MPSGAFAGAIFSRRRCVALAAATLAFLTIVRPTVDLVVEARSDARPYWQMSGVETIVRVCSLSRLAAIGAVRTAQAFWAAAFAPVAGTESATAAPSAAVACRSPAIIS